MQPDTLFDLASLTKVVATTSAVALLYQEGMLGLDNVVAASLRHQFRSHGKGRITIRHCLTHSAGLPPDPWPNYWDPRFGCEGAPLPEVQTFCCSEKIYRSVLNQRLRHRPGSKYVYSDLSMIVLMYVVGSIAFSNDLVVQSDFSPECQEALLVSNGPKGLLLQCAYEAFIRRRVLGEGGLQLQRTLFKPPGDQRRLVAPTTVPRAEGLSEVVLQGRVEDGNAEMLGGVSGHAGIFSSALDLAVFTHAWLFPTSDGRVESAAILGWDRSCGEMDASTFMHIGYTGTEICADPSRGLYTILLTNRVYPSDEGPDVYDTHVGFNNLVIDYFSHLRGRSMPFMV